jgi:hypothetical protein
MGVLAEVDRAIEEIKKEPLKQIIWQQVFNKYPPAFILDCERSVEGARQMVREWLRDGMMSGEPDPEKASKEAVSKLMDYGGTSGHNHHFLADKCREIGLRVTDIETSQPFQEAVLSVHHSFMATFARVPAIKILENSIGGNWTVKEA